MLILLTLNKNFSRPFCFVLCISVLILFRSVMQLKRKMGSGLELYTVIGVGRDQFMARVIEFFCLISI